MITRPTQPGPSLRPAAAIDRASAAHRNGNVLVARQLLQERIARNPQDADALAKLAEIALAQKSVEEATVLLQRAVSVDPSPHRRVALIVHLQRSGEPAMALAEIECLPRSVRRQSRIKEVEATVLSSLG
ncbi:MAG TPA: tetratricopeptide repeat protein, partial [Sphingomicrobium sp.]|nr:tetratricopeptide repeat protein [Sphingomicrobium sp.]